MIPTVPDSLMVRYPYPNTGGCVPLWESSSQGQACGKAYQALVECELAACVEYCPVTATSGPALLVGIVNDYGNLTAPGCIQNADTSVCASYAAARASACAGEIHGSRDAGTLDYADAGALGTCTDWTTYNEFFGYFCGNASPGSTCPCESAPGCPVVCDGVTCPPGWACCPGAPVDGGPQSLCTAAYQCCGETPL